MKKTKGRVWIRWVVLAVVAFAAYQMLSGPSGLFKLADLHKQQTHQQQLIDSLSLRKQELSEEKRRLLTDTAFLEKTARKELGMAKKGEKVYRLIKPDLLRNSTLNSNSK